MIKKMLVLFVAIGLFACNQTKKDDQQNDDVKVYSVADVKANAADLVDQEVVIKGTVTHVCKHSGKRLFLMDDNPDETFKVEAGDNLPGFDAMLEGGLVEVTGIVRELRVDEDYLQEWEAELAAEEQEEVEEGHEDGEEKHLEGAAHGGSGDIDKIAEFRQRMIDQGVDHLSFYSMEGTAVNAIELVEQEEKPAVNDTIQEVVEEVNDTIKAAVEVVE